MIDRSAFFAGVRKALGRLKQSQVDGFTRILNEAERRQTMLPRLAYMLATVWWETDRNARKFGAEKPGDLMTWPIALVALFDGMEKGMFTGRGLSSYIAPPKVDFIGARRVVNGTDRAKLIARLAVTF